MFPTPANELPVKQCSLARIAVPSHHKMDVLNDKSAARTVVSAMNQVKVHLHQNEPPSHLPTSWRCLSRRSISAKADPGQTCVVLEFFILTKRFVSGGSRSWSSATPQAVSQFTKFSVLNNSDTIFGDGTGGLIFIRATDCEFLGTVGWLYEASLNFTNCLLFRTGLSADNFDILNFTMQNCTVIGGFLCIQHLSAGWPVRFVNCIFDGTSVSMDNWGYTGYCDYNAFLANADRLSGWGAHDVTNIVSFNWQPSWLAWPRRCPINGI